MLHLRRCRVANGRRGALPPAHIGGHCHHHKTLRGAPTSTQSEVLPPAQNAGRCHQHTTRGAATSTQRGALPAAHQGVRERSLLAGCGNELQLYRVSKNTKWQAEGQPLFATMAYNQKETHNQRKMQYSSDRCIVCLTTARAFYKLSFFRNSRKRPESYKL
jgi:hypothetical protein